MSLRTVEIDGEPWFVAKDICDALGLDTTHIRRDLDADEAKVAKLAGFRGRGAIVVSESGLYALIMRSRKPDARAFRKWIASEVLPSIRKHGTYMTQEVAREAVEDPMPLMACAMWGEFSRFNSGKFANCHACSPSRSPTRYSAAGRPAVRISSICGDSITACCTSASMVRFTLSWRLPVSFASSLLPIVVQVAHALFTTRAGLVPLGYTCSERATAIRFRSVEVDIFSEQWIIRNTTSTERGYVAHETYLLRTCIHARRTDGCEPVRRRSRPGHSR
ncbi:Bro-N domain-containing protein [Burkholderia anthina]|uniref:BRO-N domain-containing protein n=1 Tax=Burkholderia anthina TaxID=179879 RepID=UPI001C88F332|nr:BRO family protein [Burkholderia anthina]